jgi:anti-sigma factor RsiW
MNCQEFWESGLVESEAAEAAHLQQCAACAARYAGEQHVAAGLKALAAQWRRTEAPARVEGRLVAAFRREMGAAPARRPLVWFPALTWAAAVAATVILALFLMQGRQPQETRRPARNTIELAAADAPYMIDVPADLEKTGFIPLPNALQIDPADEVDVVRMEVPRSTLIALGLAVEEDEESVQADVLLGGDGVARAVRFLE